MLDMGFIHDVRASSRRCPKRRQTLFFSATMPPEIARLAASILRDPVKRRRCTPGRTTVETVDQSVLLRRQGATSARCSAQLLERRGDRAARSSSRAPSTAPTASPQQLAPRRHPRRGDPRQQVAERARARARRLPHGRRRACWSRPTSPRAASTSTTSRTSSTTTCRTCPRPTCTASAARRAPGERRRALVLRRRGARLLRDIEKLIKTRIQVVADHPWHPTSSAPPSPAPRATPPTTTSRPLLHQVAATHQGCAPRPAAGHPAVRENREHAGLRPR